MTQSKGAVPKATVFRKAAKRAHPEDGMPVKRQNTKSGKVAAGAPAQGKGGESGVSKMKSAPKQVPSTTAPNAAVKAASKVAAKETKGSTQKATKKASKAAKEEPKAVPKDTPKAAPKEGLEAAPKETHKAPPKEEHTEVTSTEALSKGAKPAPMPSAMRIVAGSYERLLFGLIAFPSRRDGKLNVVLEPQFVFPAHVSSIRTVACAGTDSKWLVTGGNDETIKVWDMRRRVEVGALVGHEGTIMSLTFPSRTFMLSASEDGTINLYRTRDWSLLRTLRGHIGRVNAAAAHPSGRLALSVGADKTIRMWNLMRGVGAASVKIGIEAEQIRWNQSGSRFAVMAQRQVMVFATDMTKIAEVELPRRVHDMIFFQDEHELLLVAGDDRVVHIYNMDDLIEQDEDETTPTEIGRLIGHDNRVRSVGVVRVRNGNQGEVLAATISSDGMIRIFDLGQIIAGDSTAIAVAEYNTKRSRLTCLSVSGYVESGNAEEEEQKEEQDEEEEEDGENEENEEDEENVEMDEELDEAALEAEMKELEEQIRQAREAGIILEEDEEDDGNEEEDSEDEDDNEAEEEAEEA